MLHLELFERKEKMKQIESNIYTEEIPKKKKGLLVALLLLLLIVIGVLIASITQRPSQNQPRMREANARIGQFQGKREEEIQNELNRVVEKGMFNISINSDIYMENGESEAEVRIENVPGNQYAMGVTITLDDTGEAIYTSGLIEPNYHVQTVKLDKILDKGNYKATAIFNAYELDTEEEVGTASAKIVIKVKN